MRLLMWTTTLMLRAYPARFREAWAGEYLQTFREGCTNVSARRGLAALFRHVIAEWADVLRAAARLRRNTPREPRRPRSSVLRDLRTALRSLRAVPAHTALAITTLALGIGANAGLFSVLDSLLFRPVPFADAERLIELSNYSINGRVQFPGFNQALLREWRAQTDLFDRTEAYAGDFAVFTGVDGTEAVDMAYVTPGLMSMLGVGPLHGRIFGDDDGRDGTDARVLLSEHVWRERFGARPDLVGTAIRINGRPHDVVGIMPASFMFPNRGTDMWMPRDLTALPVAATARTEMIPLARMSPGLSIDQVSAEVRARGERLQHAAGGDSGVTAVTVPRSPRDATQTRLLQVLGGSVAFLLLIVCANLASLSLSKTLARARDVAVRSALGASRRDLLRESLAEHMVLGAAGAALGLLVAFAIVEIANQTIPIGMMSQSLNPIDLDGRTLALVTIAGILTPLLFGLPTALLASRADVSSVLTLHSRSTTGSRGARRVRNVLVTSEITLAVVLLVGAALMARSVHSLVSVDRGFVTEGLVRLRVGLPGERFRDPVARDAWTESVLGALRGLPDVTAATAGHLPPSPSGSNYGAVEFGHTGHVAESVSVPQYRVWPDYFEQIGLRLVDGRAFTANEPRHSTIVSESFAKAFWPEGSAVGGTFRFTGAAEWRTVVGVATEVRQMSTDDADGAFEWFLPLRTPPGIAPPRRPGSAVIIEDRNFVVRTTNAAATLERMKQAVRQVDSSVIVLHAFSGSVDDAFGRAVAQPRLVLVVLAMLAGTGLLLAAAGLYGVLSHLVTLRMREFGVRMALGAKPVGVFGLILRYGVSLTAAGLMVGGVAAIFLVRVMQSVLYEVDGSDPIALLAVALVLSLTAIAASWRPARRAMRADPVTLLRD
jgi:putative ABC transport system permease protein